MRTSPARVALILCVTAVAAHAQKLYWTDPVSGSIQRSNVDGTNVENLSVTGSQFLQGITADVGAAKIYWADLAAHEIHRSDLDGGNGQVLVSSPDVFFPNDIAVDPAGDAMYWTTFFGNISRANLGGGNLELLVSESGTPNGIALDITAGKMYWTVESPAVIRRANLDGSNIQDVVTPGTLDQVDTPIAIAIDPGAGKIYWSDAGKGTIQRANLNIPPGSNPQSREDLEVLVTDLTDPAGIVLEPASGTMYWADATDGTIQRADLDGSNVANIGATGIGLPFGLAIVPCSADSECEDLLFCTGQRSCDFATGLCHAGPTPCVNQVCDETSATCLGCINAEPCDDGDPCTIGDTCAGDVCSGLPADPAILCDDGDACTVESCDPFVGCQHAPAADGTSCEDGAFCNGVEECMGGLCIEGSTPCPSLGCDEDSDVCLDTGGCCFPTGACFAGTDPMDCELAGASFLGFGPTCDTDPDGDGAVGCDDGCPMDPAKIDPEACGCGNPETDSDGDNVPDCVDLCPDSPIEIPVDEDGCPIVGACCFEVGVCFDETEPADCDAAGGAYQGNRSVCGVGFCLFDDSGDADGDGDADGLDFIAFQVCLLDDGGVLPVACEVFDVDVDGDVDLIDWSGFQVRFSGPVGCVAQADCPLGEECVDDLCQPTANPDVELGASNGGPYVRMAEGDTYPAFESATPFVDSFLSLRVTGFDPGASVTLTRSIRRVDDQSTLTPENSFTVALTDTGDGISGVLDHFVFILATPANVDGALIEFTVTVTDVNDPTISASIVQTAVLDIQ